MSRLTPPLPPPPAQTPPPACPRRYLGFSRADCGQLAPRLFVRDDPSAYTVWELQQASPGIPRIFHAEVAGANTLYVSVTWPTGMGACAHAHMGWPQQGKSRRQGGRAAGQAQPQMQSSFPLSLCVAGPFWYNVVGTPEGGGPALNLTGFGLVDVNYVSFGGSDTQACRGRRRLLPAAGPRCCCAPCPARVDAPAPLKLCCPLPTPHVARPSLTSRPSCQAGCTPSRRGPTTACSGASGARPSSSAHPPSERCSGRGGTAGRACAWCHARRAPAPHLLAAACACAPAGPPSPPLPVCWWMAASSWWRA